MAVLEKKHVIMQKRSLDDSNDHEHETFKKSKTLMFGYSSPKPITQVQVNCETTQFCVGSEAHVKPLKKLSNTNTSGDLRYFVDNKDKRFKPPKSRRIHTTRLRETGKVKCLEPTYSKNGQILPLKVNITHSWRKTSNITNARNCEIRKRTFDREDKFKRTKRTFEREDKFMGSQFRKRTFDREDKFKRTFDREAKFMASQFNDDSQIYKSTAVTHSWRKASNITNARDCQIRKRTFDGEDKFKRTFDREDKFKRTFDREDEFMGSRLNDDAQISKSNATMVSRNKVRSQIIKEAKVLFDVTYKELNRNKLELNGKKDHHWKVLPMVKRIVEQKLKLMDATKVRGPVCGVEVGDTFKYRELLYLVGLHCHTKLGIDCTKINGKNLAISIVDSQRYLNGSEGSAMLTYCGEGGIGVFGRKSPPEDQKLEGRNLALKNCIDEKSPVRVIRRIRGDENTNMYVYAGLYIVKECVRTRSEEGKTLFKFHLHRTSDNLNIK